MNLDLILVGNAGGEEEVGDILALIALELDHLADLLVLHNVAIAAELFLEIFKDFVVAELLPQPLNRRQALLPIPLLYANVNILLRPGRPRFLRLGKWIEKCRDLDLEINHEFYFDGDQISLSCVIIK